MRIRYRARALADLEDIFVFSTNAARPGRAMSYAPFTSPSVNIAAHPLASPRTSDPDIRVKILGRYRYKIFYSVVATEFIEIIHIRHAARRPWIDAR